jgi:hypothetical protein
MEFMESEVEEIMRPNIFKEQLQQIGEATMHAIK